MMLHFKISSVAYLFLCFTLIVTLITTNTEATFDGSFVQYECPNTSTFSPNSAYQTNLKQLLSWLSSNSTRKNGYYNTTIGVNTPNNTIYGASLCRGDVATNTCQECVSAAATQVLQDCPVGKISVIWFAECMVRYSDQHFFSKATLVPSYQLLNTGSVSDQDRFMQVVQNTMNTAAEQAGKGGADKKFGTKEANISSLQTLYTLAQCTPDLSHYDCQQCLQSAIGQLPSCCYGKQGGRVLIPSCNIRYELYPFYHGVKVNVSVPTPRGQPSPNPKEKSGISAVVIIAIVARIVLVSLVAFTAFWIISTKARRKKYSPVPDESDPDKQQQLNWPTRYKIIEEIARGMFYLHEDS